MPKLIIDDREIEVPEGTKVIEAAERLGIMIPRFCYHWILGSVGACRMCAVKLLHKDFIGVQMSCMIDAQEGMIVSTTHPEAVQFRKSVIEWLMLNHPHDCPVCDEGGHCLLQDETVSGSHSIRRYRGKKRTFHDQDLGVFVQHEMNRCIQCYRCARFYQDFSGYRDLGVMRIADTVYFGRNADGPLESPFAGNLIDICPTGVYTDKPARYRYRRWETQRSPSLCIHCSLVCRTIANARFREVLRQEAPISDRDRGYFICDRGRYGFPFTNLPGRPRRPRVDGSEVTWDEAIGAAAEGIGNIVRASGPSAIACLGSGRSSLETQAMLKRFCRTARWPEPVYFTERSSAVKARDAVASMDDSVAISMHDMVKADFILTIGADPLNESPVLGLSMRQAWRKGATVAVIDPRPVSLPFPFQHLCVGASQVETCLGALTRNGLEREQVEELGAPALAFFDALPAPDAGGSTDDPFSRIASGLKKSRHAAIVCGTDIVRENTPAFAADCARLLNQAKRKNGGSARLLYVLREANTFGGALLSRETTLEDAISGMGAGKIKAMIIAESDPFRSFPDRERLEKALSKLEMLLVMDYLPSETVGRANIFLPTATLFEADSSFINHEGKIRIAGSVHAGGEPIHQVSGGIHPPRRFESLIPGGEPRPAWRILLDLGRVLSQSTEGDEELPARTVAEELPAPIEKDSPLEDANVIPGRIEGPGFATRAHPAEAQDPSLLELLLVDRTFGTEELADYSPIIRKVEGEPMLFMHKGDASAAGVADGDQAAIHLDGGSLELTVRVSDKVASGTLVLPRHRRLSWQKIRSRPAFVPLDGVKRVKS